MDAAIASKTRTFAFLAECLMDVLSFASAFWLPGVSDQDVVEVIATQFSDVDVLVTTSRKIDCLRDAMAEVVDGHVMWQTLHPIDKHTRNRDYSLREFRKPVL